MSFLTEVRQTLVPGADTRHGPLPPLLLALTLVTGLVDAFSYLVLGHVFVANMTGNVVFLAFALVGAPGFSIAGSAVALALFWVGALIGGRLGARRGDHRGRLLHGAVSLQSIFVAASVGLAALSATPVGSGYRYPLIVLLALAMGLQNATARKLAVPDLTTTVLTLTIVGTAADSTMVGGKGAGAGRRVLSIVAMFLGALIGAVLVVHSGIVVPLVIALVILVGIGAVMLVQWTSDAAWTHP
ncbi:MAG TPA: YoaK family protein [Acidimicrobiales bacterium]|jgi:uncharacterized membrane protein YoaK (UPF0700 family)|nr:YoaK family protein [Acidimicrobiales bacterium]